MNTPDIPDPIAMRARAEFDAARDGIDPVTAGRLRLARRTALAAKASRDWRFAPVAAAIAVALAVAWVWPRRPAPAEAPVAVTPAAPAATPAPAVPPVHVPMAPPAIAPIASTPEVESVEPAEAIDLPEDVLADEDPAWDALDGEEDEELYAWLADAPVAPDVEEDAL